VIAIHPVRRDWEYTHADWAPGRPWGGLPAYAAWLATVVKPWVDAHFPADPRREATAVLGSSHGGLASFWTATRHPDAFGEAACFSSSFFTGLDDLDTGAVAPTPLSAAPLVADVAPLLADRDRRPRLWLDWGLRRDGGPHNAIVEHLATIRGREMAARLRARFGYVDDVDLHAVEHGEGGHDEASWRTRFGWWLARPAPREEPK
jgi:pimeloyl-ACP methyl ester carboxylesterase